MNDSTYPAVAESVEDEEKHALATHISITGRV